MTDRATFLLSQIAEEVRALPIMAGPETIQRGVPPGGSSSGRGSSRGDRGHADESSATPQITGWGSGYIARVN
jgi:hypothetical protein